MSNLAAESRSDLYQSIEGRRPASLFLISFVIGRCGSGGGAMLSFGPLLPDTVFRASGVEVV